MEWVPWDTLKDIGPWGLVTFFFILVFTGYLVPARELKYWRKAFFTEQQMRQDMEVTGQLQRSILKSVPVLPEDSS